MKQTWLQMGMPITLEIDDKQATDADVIAVQDYFKFVDETFSPYKETSELSKINRKEITPDEYSPAMKYILNVAEQTKRESRGYFDIEYNGVIDTSGIVKGWAIFNAANLLKERGFTNFYLDAGGDMEISGMKQGEKWAIGIKNPFKKDEIVKVVHLSDCGIATSGTYNRGQHIYNPLTRLHSQNDIVSITVIGPNVYEADRFATPAFAMGIDGIAFIEQLPGLEGYQIDKNGIATFTTHFEEYFV